MKKQVIGIGSILKYKVTDYLSLHLLIICSSLGLTKEKPENAVWSIESMRFLSAWDRRGFSLRNSRSKLLQSLADFCGWQDRNIIMCLINLTKHSTVMGILDANRCRQPHSLASRKMISSYHFGLKRRLHFSLLQC